MKFAAIKAKQEALYVRSRSPLAIEIFHAIGSAEDNANDTVFVEHSCPESEWDTIALGSLEQIITSPDCSARARAWFKRIGVKF